MKPNYFHFLQDKLLKISDRVTDYLVKPTTQISILVFGCAITIFGVAELAASSQTSVVECPDQQAERQFSCSQETVPQISPQANRVSVDIAGAVNKPGVYELDNQLKIADAITAAGGFAKVANRSLIAQRMNLSEQLQPSQKIYIPFEEERDLPVSSSMSETTKVGDEQQTSKVINVNTADQTALETLSGIGEVTAQKIISNRPYSSMDELVEKKVLSNSLLEKLNLLIEL